MLEDLSIFYSIDTKEAFPILSSSDEGLSEESAKNYLKKYGPNEISKGKKKSFIQKLIENLLEPMSIVLAGASIFAFIIKDWIEGFAIMGVVFINTIISLIQNNKAERAVEELKKILAPQSKVLRDGNLEVIASRFIVPGDIILLEAGDIVPADCRLIEGKHLLVDESHLTGESKPIEKKSGAIKEKGLRLHEMKNILFAGSKILDGTGKALVIKTGNNTEMGKIAHSIQESEEEKTPLQKRLSREIRFLVGLAFFSGILILLVSFLRHLKFEEAILIAISIMVAVFPEGLPASITISLSLAVERMARKSVIIKKLSSVETLGNVDYICTDKTGTITQHNMTVKEYYINGHYLINTEILKMIAEGKSDLLQDIFLTSIKCSSAQVVERDGNIIKEVGDPTEISLIKSAILMGFKPHQFKTLQIIDSIPFSSDLMYSASLIEDISGHKSIYIKGAPDKILSLCNYYYVDGKTARFEKAQLQKIYNDISRYSEKGFRIIGFAKKKAFDTDSKLTNVATGFTFLGCAVIYDPPKDEVKNVIKTAKEANINVVMITGDSKKTGLSIAESVGIASSKDEAIDGKELESLKKSEFSRLVEHLRVYSRVSPIDKLKIVDKLKSKGHIVAMTGDGVNDAPALKKADVGIAMGKAGTQVSQEAADIILTDDNFATILAGIREGRTIFQNIKKLIKYLITNNIGKVFTVLVAPILGYPPTLLPIQILWSNIVMESLPSIAITTDPADDGIMKKKPSKLSEALISLRDRFHIILDGLLFGMCITIGYIISYKISGGDKAISQTVSFTITLLSPQLYVFILRDGSLLKKFLRPNLLLKLTALLTFFMTICIIYLQPLNIIFNTKPILDVKYWYIIALASIIPSINRLILKYKN